MAATEPVTPSNTLAMAALLVQALHGVQEARRQLRALHALVTAGTRANEGPVLRPFQGVGDHQFRARLLTGLLSNFKQFVVADADFELKLDQQATELPVGTDAIHELRRAHQAQP